MSALPLGKETGGWLVVRRCLLFPSSDVLHKLRVEEGESGKLVLVEVHHEELVRGREVRFLGGELAVKVGDVLAVADFGFERRLDLPVGDLLPVDPPEELVALDVLLALLPASKTLRRVLDQKPFAYLLSLSRERLGVGDGVVGDGREQLLLVLAVERRLSHQHLVQQNSERPPINGLVVRLVVDDFRRDVVRSAAKGLGGVVAQYLLLAHSEVRDLDVTVLKEWAGIEDARSSSLH